MNSVGKLKKFSFYVTSWIGLSMISGGYNLKGSGYSIEHMKFDMGGAAAAFGAAKAIASICPLGVEVTQSLSI